jgi:acetolactate synthase regulatory subunit
LHFLSGYKYGCEINKSERPAAELIVAGRHPPILFQTMKETLYDVSTFVDLPVIRTRLFSIFSQRYHGDGIATENLRPKRIRVVCLICDDVLARIPRNQRRRLFDVMAVAGNC